MIRRHWYEIDPSYQGEIQRLLLLLKTADKAMVSVMRHADRCVGRSAESYIEEFLWKRTNALFAIKALRNECK